MHRLTELGIFSAEGTITRLSREVRQDTRRCCALQKSRLVSTPQCVFVKHSTDIIGEKDGKGLIFKKSMDASVIFIFLSMADHI